MSFVTARNTPLVRPVWTRVLSKVCLGGLVAVALVACVLPTTSSSSSSSSSSCKVDTWRCDGAELQHCDGHPGGPSGGLEAQFVRTEPRILQISNGSSYRYIYDRNARKGTLDATSIRIHGAPLDPAKSYRVTVNSFLAAGGDGFSVLKEGTARVTGVKDIEALTGYLGKVSSAAAPLDPERGIGRVVGDGCK